MNVKGKKILIVGFGLSGRAAARYLMEAGAKVEINDAGPAPDDAVLAEFRKIPMHWGGHPEEVFEGRDLIVLSPGVSASLPAIKKALRKSRKTRVVGEFGLAAECLKDLKIPMIAVTGTNGKSTTVTLIHRMLQASGQKSVLAGNIGKPLIEAVSEIESSPKKKRPDWVVAEVSSYQLETVISPFQPEISVLLNVTPDHLDRYESFEDYARAKFRIFSEQSRSGTVIYRDILQGNDSLLRKNVAKSKARRIPFPADRLYLESGMIFFGKESYPLAKTKLIGVHNRENLMAAVAAARTAEAKPQAIQKVIETFEGLPHRTQFVRDRGGIRFYDDSKGTNVDAAVKSLAGFPDRRVVLILGGREKGGSYEPLKQMAQQKVKLAICIGESRARLAQVLKDAVDVAVIEGLKDAVPAAFAQATAGDVVLLSPACSSFDQFRDYKHRGDYFQELVRKL